MSCPLPSAVIPHFHPDLCPQQPHMGHTHPCKQKEKENNKEIEEKRKNNPQTKR